MWGWVGLRSQVVRTRRGIYARKTRRYDAPHDCCPTNQTVFTGLRKRTPERVALAGFNALSWRPFRKMKNGRELPLACDTAAILCRPQCTMFIPFRQHHKLHPQHRRRHIADPSQQRASFSSDNRGVLNNRSALLDFDSLEEHVTLDRDQARPRLACPRPVDLNANPTLRQNNRRADAQPFRQKERKANRTSWHLVAYHDIAKFERGDFVCSLHHIDYFAGLHRPKYGRVELR